MIQVGRQQSTLVGKFLSLRPFVFTGLISYSLYLWHYPVLVLATYYLLEEVHGFGLGLVLASVYLIALASWKWIELPIRRRQVLRSNRRFATCAVMVSIVILVTGIVFWKSDGLPWRFPPETRVQGIAWLWDGDFPPKCVNISFDKIASGRLCSVGPQDDDAVRGVVWGDSHAMALLPAYEQLAKLHHVRLYFAVRTSCRPLVGTTKKPWTEAWNSQCGSFNAAAAQAVRNLDPDLLILNAHWIDPDADLVSQSSEDFDPKDSNFKRGLVETLRAAGSLNRSVCIVLDVPDTSTICRRRSA